MEDPRLAERQRFESADLLGKLELCGVEFRRRFYQREDPADISKSIQSFRKAVELTPPDHVDLPSRLGNLGLSLMLQFERLGQLRDINEAVTTLQHVVGLVPESHPDFLLHAGTLGSAMQNRSQTTGELSDIDEGIMWTKKAVEMTPEGQPALASWLTNLGNAFNARFEHTGDLNDNAEAISAQKRAVELVPEKDRKLPAALNCLGVSFQTRFERTDTLPDIDQAVATLERAVRLTTEDHIDLPSVLANLGASLTCRFNRLGRRSDLAQGIEVLEKAVQLTPDDRPELPILLDSLSSSLKSRFQYTEDLSDIDRAISTAQKAVELTAEENTGLPKSYTTLGTAHLSRFASTAQSNDLDQSISSYRKAAQLTPEDHASLPERLYNLGTAIHVRWKATKADSALIEAILVMKACVQLISETHPDYARFLVGHGVALFEMTGDFMHLSGAISAAQQDVYRCPDGHISLPAKLSSLGGVFLSRYENTGDHDDITESVRALRRAVELTDHDHPSRSMLLTELGSSLSYLFESEGNVEYLSEAISLQREAIRLTPSPHANLPFQLGSLSTSLTRRFEISSVRPDIIEAIEVQQRAIKLTPPDHARLPILLQNLGVAFIRRCDGSDDLDGVDEAIDAFRRAVRLIPATHVELCSVHRNLGNALRRRYVMSNDTEDAKECIDHYRFASTFQFAPPHLRLEAGKNWTRSLRTYLPESHEILTAFDTSIGLAALLAGMEQTTRRRYTYLQEMSGIPLDAAAVAVRHERPDKAVEWLEQGRCLVWGQLTALRTPLQDLGLQDEALAQELLTVSKALESSGSESRSTRLDMTIPEKLSIEHAARTQMELATKWTRLLEKARAIPGFETFLQPSPLKSICQDLPTSGFVVVININEDRCDAMALSSGLEKVRHIPLLSFTLSKAKKSCLNLRRKLNAQGLRKREDLEEPEAKEQGEVEEYPTEGATHRVGGTYRRSRTGDQDNIHQLLRSLWIEVVHPILTTLDISKYDASSKHPRPRIWWCPTGPLSFLPLHAAGNYAGLECESALDYVVSSYTPTVSSLTRRVKEARITSADVSGLFLTNHPKAPGFPVIMGTEREVRTIYDEAKESGIQAMNVEGDSLSVEDCLKYMEQYSCIHLACHASQDASDPLRSRFRFHSGILDLDAISKKDLKNADLAFLSACETSTGAEMLPDEAVHLAAGMLAAGYRRVVATMWSIGDQHAPDVAIDFYRYLWGAREEGGGTGFDGSLSAHALHHATQKLRHELDNTEKSLLAWIPYVHFGY